jgi:hypothetical protein
VIAAFDFFTVPTLTSQTLYCFFVIKHGRRRLLHFNCTAHPTSEWILQQLRQALLLPCPYRYVLFAYDAKFGHDVLAFLQVSGIAATRTSVRSPWQNGVAERWTGSVRREVFDHIILLNEPIFAGLVLSIWPTITKTAHTRIEQGHALRATATKVEGASQQKSLHAGKEKGHKNQREQLPLTG